ncbi:MAG: NAD(P)-dependent oxidoreductase [Nitrososphaerales archaeon]
MLDMHRLIITGASGFIGSHALNYFREKGYETLGIDKVAKENVLTCDLTDFDNTYKLFKDFKPDYVIHLAVIMKDEEFNLIRDNLTMNLNVLEASLRVGVKRFVYMSSSTVYGLPTKDEPIDENSNLNPLSGYAASKIATEYLVLRYCKLGLPCVIFRGFEVYGKGVTSGIVKILVENALYKKHIKVFCYGEQKTDFTHVLDLCQAYELGLKNLETCKVYNVGSGVPRSYKDLAEVISSLLGCSVEYLPCRDKDIAFKLYPKIDRLKSYGFEPKHLDLKKGIEEVVSYYR